MSASMGGQVGQMPPEELAALSAMLGTPGAAPGAPPAAAPVDPAAGAPTAPVAGALPGFPSTDPALIAQAAQQMQAADQAQLAAAQQSAMQTAAASMGGPAAATTPPGVPPLGGDPFAGGSVPVSGLGPAPLPPELAAAYGGPDMGAMQSESVQQLPGSEYAPELGSY